MTTDRIQGLGEAPEGEKTDIEAAVRNFERHGFTVRHFATGQEAADYLADTIRDHSVGFGDSHTLSAIGIAKRLEEKNLVTDPGACPGSLFELAAEKALNAEIFLTSVNAAAQTGELVNIDSSGNRVAGSLFGHKKVYYVFSVSKLEPTLERAVWRARNIAAPRNAKRFGFRTPCAIKGDRCYNCASPDRICNKIVIYLRKGKVMDEEIVVIDEELGF